VGTKRENETTNIVLCVDKTSRTTSTVKNQVK
jgi:hypothetical protein